MENYYKLQIRFEPSFETFKELTSILGVKPADNNSENSPDNTPSIWAYYVLEHETDKYFDFINIFLDLLETKFVAIENLNIERKDITFWQYYEYDSQCNMEFDPIRLKRLGDNGIKLCISCWYSGKE